MTIALLSGGWDPVHPGHIEMFNEARHMKAWQVTVLVNSDEWLKRKKGKPFMPQADRIAVLKAMKNVHRVIGLTAEEDADDTVVQALRNLCKRYPDEKFAFLNGGDRGDTTTPEAIVAEELDIEMHYGVGSEDKTASSSWYLSDWKNNITHRHWGLFNVIAESEFCKVKQLYIKPGQSISLQYHQHREEHWVITAGKGFVSQNKKQWHVNPGDYIHVERGDMHQIKNLSKTEILELVEVQRGSILNEEDIVRFP